MGAIARRWRWTFFSAREDVYQWWTRATERAALTVAYLLPQRVVYWAIVRATEKAGQRMIRPKWLNRGIIWGPSDKYTVGYVVEKWVAVPGDSLVRRDPRERRKR